MPYKVQTGAAGDGGLFGWEVWEWNLQTGTVGAGQTVDYTISPPTGYEYQMWVSAAILDRTDSSSSYVELRFSGSGRPFQRSISAWPHAYGSMLHLNSGEGVVVRIRNAGSSSRSYAIAWGGFRKQI